VIADEALLFTAVIAPGKHGCGKNLGNQVIYSTAPQPQQDTPIHKT